MNGTSKSTNIEATEFNGQPAWRLTRPSGAQATILNHGAHLVSWCVADGLERLYLSPQSSFAPGKAVRGGVPVIFPQFSNFGPDHNAPRHGFARHRIWQRNKEVPGLCLCLRSDPQTLELWPYAFELAMQFELDDTQLKLKLTAHNVGNADFAFSAALHSYFRVQDMKSLHVCGLEQVGYYDSVAGREANAQGQPLSIDGELDRIYWNAPVELQLQEATRSLAICCTGFHDAVVWNPGAARCAELSDMPADGWQNMICVESAQIAKPVRLAPMESWVAEQVLLAITPMPRQSPCMKLPRNT